VITALLVAYAIAATVIAAVAVGGNADLAQENRRLRGDHLHLIHPATRKARR
jgi:hypothetical protein